ncbi:FAD-dependent oxidoreductase [Chelativorans sp. AA-79]|uniref:NAD(P)/FAD-dependent oxidoreductase n=1 Tax=Chelativorans sp. AA-79 TaxID=3028735 RepID=UPI0023F6BF42|nr:FAD-dependent oxidoreductase [Chelativorans sp. AA-79]WEX08279.1 FAD-dependent oxidoreductase [Chelativorans sp. AA-79]
MQDLGTRELVVVGGGLVGLAVGLGAARFGADVLVLDADDGAFRAARGNFGLVWAQSKGARGRDYAVWTRRAVADWKALETELIDLAGVETHFRTGLGLHLCLGEAEFEKRRRLIDKVAGYSLPDGGPRMIRREEVTEILPGVGPEVTGASVSTLDGDCHSLALYRGLSIAFGKAGGELLTNAPVTSIASAGNGYRVTAGRRVVRADRVLLAAGLAINTLARPLGFPDIVRPQRGQILVTERTRPFLPVVTSDLRQTPEGSALIGDTKEEAGFDDRSSREGIAYLARRAVRLFPALSGARVVRSWAALRVLTADGDPVYDESPTHPGIFVAATHSGVTLAPAHRGPLAQWILRGQKPPEFKAFTASRFAREPVNQQQH